MTVDARQITLAEYFVDVGQPMRALEALQDPDSEMLESSDFWRLRARAYHMLEQWDKTMEVALQGLARNPDSIALLYLAADAEAEMDKLAEAERTILAALAIEPEHPSLLCAYARIAARGGQLDKAEKLVDEAERVEPHGSEALRTRTLLALLRGKDREATRFSEELLAVDPDDPGAHRMRAAALLQRGHVHAGRASLETAVRDEPGDFALAHSARQARIASHPLMWPVIPIMRLGAAGSWFVAIAIIFGLRALGYNQASSIAGFVWLAIVVYSWMAVPVVQRRLERQQRP